MEKSMAMIAAVLTSISLTSFGFRNWPSNTLDKKGASKIAITEPVSDFWNPASWVSDVDLVYHVDHRFVTTITKEILHNAKSITDILPVKAIKSVETYKNARISILYDESETTEIGDGDLLNAAQSALLMTTDYSTDIRITSICQKRNNDGELVEDSLVYYMTVIPEQVAEFAGGQEALINYLRENSREKVAIIKEDERQASKIRFTVTKKGTIANVQMTGTTGYSSVDKALVELIIQMPQKWTPALNSKGEKVDQELVFFFGLQGC